MDGPLPQARDHSRLQSIWGFPKIRGTFSGVPIIRNIVFWGLSGGPPILGNYHMYYSLSSLEGVI